MATRAARARPALPIRSGSAAEFAAARECLIEARFTEAAICERVGIDRIEHFRATWQGRPRGEMRDGLDALIRLFLDSERVHRAMLRMLLPADGEARLEALGLIIDADEEPEMCEATVLLYPTASLYIISDRSHNTSGQSCPLPDDVVYPAITINTRTFLASLPNTPCERFLEVCGGTGIAALAASRYAQHAWTTDITERATRFAEFNARLNGIENVTAVRGDLYAPVRGLTFDRIVAHPPYMAEPEQRLIFRDGGPDGEQITRGLVAGLAEYLEPGGRFYCTCVATDRTGAPIEKRVRTMLGPAAGEFDVIVVVLEIHHPTEYYCRLAARGRATFAEAERRHRAYRELGVEGLVYCSMLVERHAAPREPLTVRRMVGATPVADALDWLLAWSVAKASPAMAQRLLGSRPIVPASVRLRAEQRLQNGGWTPEKCTLITDRPFRTDATCSVDTALFLTRCDGRLTLREHAARLVEEQMLAADSAEEVLVSLAGSLIDAGCLEVDAFRLPGSPS